MNKWKEFTRPCDGEVDRWECKQCKGCMGCDECSDWKGFVITYNKLLKHNQYWAALHFGEVRLIGKFNTLEDAKAYCEKWI